MNMQIPSFVNQQPIYIFCGWILTLMCRWAYYSNLMCFCGQAFNSEIKKAAFGSKHIVTLIEYRHARVFFFWIPGLRSNLCC